MVLPSETREQWVVEKNMIPNSPCSYLLAPNMLIEAGRLACVPLSNPTGVPKMLRKGDVMGTIYRASEYFDSPQDDLHHERMSKTAMLIEKLVYNQFPSQEPESEEDEGGPKTASMPETLEYPSIDLR